MKLLTIIFVCTFLGACNQGNKEMTVSAKDSAVNTSTAYADSAAAHAAAVPDSIKHLPLDQLIIPGQSIGLTSIGQSTEAAMKNLGKPDEGDAAMGKSVNTWYAKKDPPFKTQVYSSMLNGDEGDYPRVKSIRINNPFFQTDTGLKPGSNLKEILSTFPALLLSGSYKTALGKSVRLYDDTQKGIAFEIAENDSCVGICVHTPNEKAFVQYLPFEQSFTPSDN